MSQDFNFGFDSFNQEYEQNSTDKPNVPSEYGVSSAVRNVCFAWPDGRRKFLNYAYLVSADYLPEDGIIQLTFTSTTIDIRGVRLDVLHDKLLFHLPIKIICQDSRYNHITDTDYCVNEIIEK